MNAENLILEKVNHWFETDQEALNWYNNTVIPSFGMTASQVLKKNGIKGEKAVINYIEGKEMGGFE